jgi:hemolysin III
MLAAMSTLLAPYSRHEELAHSLTAGLGIVACVVAIPWLMAASYGDPWRMAAALAFGASALAMFVTSVFYHHERDLERKSRLRRLDHAAIYLLIAGTYTPVTLLALQRAWGVPLFVTIWALAALGIVAKNTAIGFRYPKLSVTLYLVMGWLAIIAIKPMLASLSGTQLGWILAGGIAYTAGVPFYVWKSRRYTHAVWHLFVLGGVACHFAAVLSLVRVD